MIRRHDRQLLAVALAVAAFGAACSGENQGVLPPVPTAPTAPVRTTGSPAVTTEPTTTAATAVTSAPTSTATAPAVPTTAPGVPVTTPAFGVLPDDIGVKVDTAPEVTTQGDIREIDPLLWVFVPSALDPNDINVIPPTPDDIEILAAYIEAQDAFNEMVVQRPIVVEPTPRLAAATDDGGAAASDGLRVRAERGQYYDMREGTVLRPHVVAEERTETTAIVFDCQIIRSGWVNADGTPPVAIPEGFGRYPQIGYMTKIDGRWVAATITSDDRVCA